MTEFFNDLAEQLPEVPRLELLRGIRTCGSHAQHGGGRERSVLDQQRCPPKQRRVEEVAHA